MLAWDKESTKVQLDISSLYEQGLGGGGDLKMVESFKGMVL